MQHIGMLRAVSVIVILLVTATLAGSASGQEIAFIESFDDPSLTGWEHSPEVEVAHGTLRVPGPSGFAYRGGGHRDFTLFVRARRSGEGDLLILCRWSDVGQYAVRLGDDFVAVQRVAGGVVTQLATAPVTIPADQWLQVGVTVAGGEYVVMLDEQAPLTGTDPDPLPPGGVGFLVEDQAVGEFDDLEMTVSGGVPPPEDQTEASPTISDHPPAYQVGTWTHLGGPIGGLGYDIRHSFDDHDVWYVTDVWAGIHRSTDRGLTWKPINQGIDAIRGVDGVPIFSATVDPHNSDVIWIGTDLTGQIYRTSDGGDTWIERSNGIDRSLNPLSFRGFTVDPTTQDTVYAMGEIGSIGWSEDGIQRTGLELDLTKGIVYKTTDGGQNWVEIWRGDNLARYCWINPNNPDVLYVSTGIVDREAANTDVEAGFAGGVGILKSTDGGQTWDVLDQANGLLDLYVGSLYMHPEDPETLLAAASQNNWSSYGGEFTGGVFMTQDGGENWVRVIDNPELFSSVEYCTVDPTIAYAASLRAVYRSEDGGFTWQRFGRPDNTWGPPGIIAGFAIDIQCDPDDPMRVFVNNYLGGNFLSEDGGETWANASQGYSGAMIRQLAIASGQSGWVYAGGRSGLFRSTDGGATWDGLAYPGPEFSYALMNEVSALAIHPDDPRSLLAAPGDVSAVTYSSDGGNSWNLASGLPGLPWSVVIAPSNPLKAYAAVTGTECTPQAGAIKLEVCANAENSFHASEDGGRTWVRPSQEELPSLGFVALLAHPEKSDTLYAGTINQGVVKTEDGGQTWSPVSEGLPIGERVQTLALDPTQPDTLFAGYKNMGVYKSIDGGQTWRRTTAGLIPEAWVTSLVVDQTNSEIVYLADRGSGVYVSTDGGETWRAINDGLDHRAVNVLALSDDGTVLYAGIEGGGVYRLGTPSGAQPVASATVLIGPVLPVGTPSEAEATTAPLPCGLPGICPLGAALPAALLGLVWVSYRRR